MSTESAPTQKHRRGALTWVAVVVLVVALVVGVRLIIIGSRTVEPEPAPLPSQPFSVNPSRIPTDVPTTADCSPATGANHLVIPRLCISTELVTTAIAGNELVIPVDARKAAVWEGGPTVEPADAGTTLVAGHVHMSGQGNGALFDLAKVQPGDLVQAYDAEGKLTEWRITELRSVHKKALPQDVFEGKDGPRRMVIVTCGGDITTLGNGARIYEDNVIATAVPVN